MTVCYYCGQTREPCVHEQRIREQQERSEMQSLDPFAHEVTQPGISGSYVSPLTQAVERAASRCPFAEDSAGNFVVGYTLTAIPQGAMVVVDSNGYLRPFVIDI